MTWTLAIIFCWSVLGCPRDSAIYEYGFATQHACLSRAAELWRETQRDGATGRWQECWQERNA